MIGISKQQQLKKTRVKPKVSNKNKSKITKEDKKYTVVKFNDRH